MQGRGRERGGVGGWGNDDGGMMLGSGPGTGVSPARGWYHGRALGPSPAPGPGAIGGCRQGGYSGVEMEYGSQPPPGRSVGRGAISGALVGLGGHRGAIIGENGHPRVPPTGGQFGGGMGALGRVGPGAAVYPERRGRLGGRMNAGGLRGGSPGMGQFVGSKGPGGGGLVRPAGRPCRPDVAKGAGSSAAIGGMRCPEDKKQVCQFFLRTGTCAFGNRCKFFHPRDHRPPKLNPKGYPLRSDEKNCAFYMKHGWCAFGATCKFNHPFPPPEEHAKSPVQPMAPPSGQNPLQQPHGQQTVQSVKAVKDEQVAPTVFSQVVVPMDHPAQTLSASAPGFLAGSWPAVPNLWYPVGISGAELAALSHPIPSGPLDTVAVTLKPGCPDSAEEDSTPMIKAIVSQKVGAVALGETSEESGRSSRTSFDGSFSPDEATSQLCQPGRTKLVNEVKPGSLAAWKEESGGLGA